MAIPTNSFTAVVLLILCFLFLGLWSSTFKAAGNRWRFELYSFDFAIGGLLFAAIAAYTLGTFGTDVGFTDHLMISSRTNQFIVFVAGCVFAFGSMLLLSGMALLGLTFSYAIATAAALLPLAAFQFNGSRAVYLGAAGGMALLALIVEVRAASKAEKTLPAVSLPILVRKSASGRTLKPAPDGGSLPNSSKGTIVSILGGLSLGLMATPLKKAVFEEFGLGPFAGLFLFSSGVLAATLLLNFYFMNIAVHGGSLNFKHYLQGSLSQHLLGIVGGALCGAGILLLLMVGAYPAEDQPDKFWLILAPLAAGFLAMAAGLGKWREQAQAPSSVRRALLIGALLLVFAIGFFVLAMEKLVLPPLPASGFAQTQLLA